MFEETRRRRRERRRHDRDRSPPRSRWARASRRRFAQLAVDVFGVPIERSAYRSATPIAAPASAAPARARCSSAARRCASRRSARWTRRRTSRRMRSKRPPPTSNTATACSASPAPIGASACSSLRDEQPDAADRRSSRRAPSSATWPNGCHVCEVEVDPDTGDVELDALLVGQRRRPRRQSDDRDRPARRRRRAGHRPGAVRAVRLRRAIGPGADRRRFMDYALPRADRS